MRASHTAVIAALAVATAAPAARAQTATDAPDGGEDTRYDAAFDALVRGDLDAAIAGFDAVAAATADPERRAAARELARLARALKQRAASAAPGARPPSPRPAHTPKTPPAEPTGDVDSSDRSGRIEFVTVTTLTGTYAGVVLLSIFDVEDFRAGTLLVTGTTAAGLFGSYFATKDRRITTGMADAYTAGVTLGALNGALLSAPLGLHDTDDALSFVLGTTVAGGAAALALADRMHPTRAQSSLTLTLSIAGLSTAGLGMVIADYEPSDDDTALLVLAGGLNAGMVAGMVAARDLDWSHSRGRLVALSTFLGALGGVASGALVVGEPDDDAESRILAATTLGGLWAGFGLGAYLTRDMQPDPRFGAAAGQQVAVYPSAIDGKLGLAVAGTF
ncbi:MAG: hypothetical protein D6689_07755 [Deltaproteobacteria bacterium]|nr:MAG: hypothetical protein D6689_07755 [Deltaproteobacteria bacterium]